MRAYVAVSLIALAAVGCKRANDRYCDQSTPCDVGTCNLTTNECEVGAADAGPDATVCSDNGDCTSQNSPICDDGSGMCRGCDNGGECSAKDATLPECAPSGACVQCLDSDMCAADAPICNGGVCELCTGDPECEDRDPATPRCGIDGRCGECVDHADCGSGVCDRGAATCVDESAIIRVKTDGSDDTGCGDVGDECRTITFALGEAAAGRNTVLVAAGIYSESVDADGVDALIVGPTTAIVRPSNSDDAAMFVLGGATIAIDGLTLQDAFGTSSADGINCTGGSSSVTARDTVIYRNAASGVDARNGCTVDLEDVEILSNGVIGANVEDGEIRLRRSLVQANDGGGVRIIDSSFDVVNNMIVLNGTNGGSVFVGGVRIEMNTSEPTMVFEFNTVAANLSDSGGLASGVHCLGEVTVSNNIVWGGAGAAIVGGNCTWSYSDVEGGIDGTENLEVDPEFLDESTDNYHLDPSSPLKDKADPAATEPLDFDGEGRPRGARSDIGADEAPVN